jgi:hypothetical protein
MFITLCLMLECESEVVVRPPKSDVEALGEGVDVVAVVVVAAVVGSYK